MSMEYFIIAIGLAVIAFVIGMLTATPKFRDDIMYMRRDGSDWVIVPRENHLLPSLDEFLAAWIVQNVPLDQLGIRTIYERSWSENGILLIMTKDVPITRYDFKDYDVLDWWC